MSESQRYITHKMSSVHFDKSSFITTNYTTFQSNYKLLRKVISKSKARLNSRSIWRNKTVFTSDNEVDPFCQNNAMRITGNQDERPFLQRNKYPPQTGRIDCEIQDHPNILKLYEFYEDEKRYYLVSEPCTGGELFDRIIEQQTFSEAEAAHFMREILSAVNYFHSLGVVHRDLKPENIMFANQENGALLKVVNFGTSAIMLNQRHLHSCQGSAYYVAPEVLNEEYNEKCDIWSCGVIMYLLLSGEPPFKGRNDDQILKRVKEGSYSLRSQEFKHISPNGKDLLKKLMKYNQFKRITASQALKHPWFKQYPTHQRIELTRSIVQENGKDPLIRALQNLANFRAQHKLQQAVLLLIATQLIGERDMAHLENVFLSLDIDEDGMLTGQQLLEGRLQANSIGYRKCFGAGSMSEQEMNEIMKGCDVDGNGSINYSEFVMGAINSERYLTQEKLKQAFLYFDKNEDGNIEINELKHVLGFNKNIHQDLWHQMIREVDTNRDGEISFEEFKNMIQNSFLNHRLKTQPLKSKTKHFFQFLPSLAASFHEGVSIPQLLKSESGVDSFNGSFIQIEGVAQVSEEEKSKDQNYKSLSGFSSEREEDETPVFQRRVIKLKSIEEEKPSRDQSVESV